MSEAPQTPIGKRLKTMASNSSGGFECNAAAYRGRSGSDSSSSLEGGAGEPDFSEPSYAAPGVSGSSGSFATRRSQRWRCGTFFAGSSPKTSDDNLNILSACIASSRQPARARLTSGTDKNLHGCEDHSDNDEDARRRLSDDTGPASHRAEGNDSDQDSRGDRDDDEDDDDDDLRDETDFVDYDFYLYDESDSDDNIDHSLPDEYLKHDPTPETQYPKPDWITVQELAQRRCGFSSRQMMPTRQNMFWFERYVNNSLWMIQRLELSKRLEEHTGCVNCLSFNDTGSLLCSGSDDLLVCIWDWQKNKLKSKIYTGHIGNVFQCRFCNSDRNIVTSSRDGSIRLVDIETHQSEELLAQLGEIGKIDFINPQTFVTCGTNASVNLIDFRVRQPTNLFTVRSPDTHERCPLHSINVHPIDKYKVVVAGASPYVFLYDLRRVARNQQDYEHEPTHCLDNFEDSNNIVTSTAFNSMGDNLLISYNDDDLMVCRTDTFEVFHRYKGHRNKKTIKGCAWFGDNFVMSGSDDGHIYGWDLDSEHIVCFLEGDSKGVVNCLSTHPRLPILASSGHDSNVKVWEPISKTWPQTLKGIKPQICKNTMRRKREKGRRCLVVQNHSDSETDTDL